MECCCSCIKDSIPLIYSGVDLVIRGPASLNIEHHIANCVVLVAVVVVINIYRPTVEVPVSILGVTGLFMCINTPIQKVDEFVFVVYN